MRVLLLHNRYQLRGGEDAVVDDERRWLEVAGCDVRLLERDNAALKDQSTWRTGLDTLWSSRARAELAAMCRDWCPDVVHAHNTFPQFSPAVYWAAAETGVPLVQTLHNFRLLCANALLLRQGRPCEDCLGRLPWRGVLHRCYRDSAVQSLILVAMTGLHRSSGSYRNKVSRYIALSEFSRDKFIAGGLPAERLRIKPNACEDPGRPDPATAHRRQGLLYVGRLSPEKGIATLLQAVALSGLTLTVIGEGPLQPDVAAAPGVRYLGPQPRAVVLDAMRKARALVLPSVCYENLPRTLVEAYALGLPVLASNSGSLRELVIQDQTGWRVAPGEVPPLAAAMQAALELPAPRWSVHSEAARRVYEQRYLPETNMRLLLALYEEVRAERL